MQTGTEKAQKASSHRAYETTPAVPDALTCFMSFSVSVSSSSSSFLTSTLASPFPSEVMTPGLSIVAKPDSSLSVANRGVRDAAFLYWTSDARRPPKDGFGANDWTVASERRNAQRYVFIVAIRYQFECELLCSRVGLKLYYVIPLLKQEWLLVLLIWRLRAEID